MLTVSQDYVMDSLHACGRLTAIQIADRYRASDPQRYKYCESPRASTYRSLAKLERVGWVRRVGWSGSSVLWEAIL